MEEPLDGQAAARVLQVFLDDPGTPRYGYDLIELTGFSAGRLYLTLARLHAAGWLSKEVEAADPACPERPPRRRYRIEAAALPHARQQLAALSVPPPQRRPRGEQLRPIPGSP